MSTNFNDYMVDKVSRVTVIQKTTNTKTRKQSQNSFSKVLKRAVNKVNADGYRTVRTLEEKDPFNGKMGKA